MALRLGLMATADGEPVTGLALSDFAVDVWRVNRASKQAEQVVTADPLDVEAGGGFYVYHDEGVDTGTYDYFGRVWYQGNAQLDQVVWIGILQVPTDSVFAIALFATKNGEPVTGLSLDDFALNLWSVDRGDQSVAHVLQDVAVGLEVGGGFYVTYPEAVDLALRDYYACVSYTGPVGLDTKLWALGEQKTTDVSAPWVSVDELREYIGKDQDELRNMTQAEIDLMLARLIARAQGHVSEYVRQSYIGQAVPSPVKDVTLRLAANIFNYVLKVRREPLLQASEFEVKLIDDSVFTPALRRDLRPYRGNVPLGVVA